MPLYEECRIAIPLGQPTSNSESDSSSADHLKDLSFISNSIDCDERCTDHVSEISHERRRGRKEPLMTLRSQCPTQCFGEHVKDGRKVMASMVGKSGGVSMIVKSRLYYLPSELVTNRWSY